MSRANQYAQNDQQAEANPQAQTISSIDVVEDMTGPRNNWDWKDSQVQRMSNSPGMEFFSIDSVTPDTTLLMAGPPRVTEEGFSEKLHPIGLVTDVNFSSDNQLRPIWEIGTDQTYFTRGKTMYQLQIGAMVANKASLMKMLTRQSPSPDAEEHGEDPQPQQSGQFWANLDTDATSMPFGILVIFKTKGTYDKSREAEHAWYKSDMEYYEGETKRANEEKKARDKASLNRTMDLKLKKAKNRSEGVYDPTIDRELSNEYDSREVPPEDVGKPPLKKQYFKNGNFVGGLYLENCNIGNFSFGINSSAVSIQENVTIMFDRALSIDFSTEDEAASDAEEERLDAQY